MPLRAKIATNNMASSTSLQEQLEKAVQEGKVPQGVVFAASRDGEWLFFFCFDVLWCWEGGYVMANIAAALMG